MLIDARHREETRVAVVKGNRIEEFDFESAERKQLKGNIYLAKVTRVEPSLQAAFVDYGGNRHGFLAFSEIHPDYYQIPKEDRDALLREEAEHAAEEAALRAELDADDALHDDDGEVIEVDHDHHDHDDEGAEDEGGEDDAGEDAASAEDEEAPVAEGKPRRKRRGRGASDDAVEDLRERRMNLRRRYKIQDVIRRRQVLLVQVVKEERGNKGAALTTYLSLAGRYCVLMPNTSHGGGISRKISNAGDRKRLKSIMADLQLPQSMGCIVRTAGLQRTKTEIKRDFDYLARLWDEIRDKTLSSSAPALIYGDSDLLKRAIRDIYNRDIDEVIVEGEEGYRQAREFMKLLMPSHARKVKHYSDPIPLFQRAHVEDQLSAMYNPVVQLKSGGYLVINPTEALVSIDINSGRSTREHNIEQTATATNLEAAHEIARQLRLRDMAGLVVIDFIDMDNGSNVRKVEKAMKEALKNDRARIQVGRISSFGLMEMSRQRLRTGVLEASTRQCPHCEGTGLVRTASSSGLSALRLIEDEAARGRGSCITLRCSMEAAFYLLNRKRGDIAEIEDRYGVSVEVTPEGENEGARMAVEASGPPPAHPPRFEAPIIDNDDDLPEIEEELDEEEEAEEASAADVDADADGERAARAERPEREEGEGGRRRRRRRGRGRRNRGGEDENGSDAERGSEGEGEFVGEQPLAAEDAASDPQEGEDEGQVVEAGAEQSGDEQAGEGEGRRRRGRRGRRGGRRGNGEASADAVTEAEAPAPEAEPAVEPAPVAQEPEVAQPADAPADAPAEAPAAEEPVAEEAPKTRRRPRARKAEPVVEAPAAEAPAAAVDAGEAPAAAEEPAPKPKRTRRKAASAETPAEPDGATAEEAPAKPKRSRRKAAAPEAPAETPAGNADVQVAEPEAPVAEAPAPSAEAPAEDPAAAASNDAEPGAAPRRGWWQRTFGN
ncbi:ribonuclease E/G [Sphingomonas aracearum]|uniref:Ribonuclease E n=2 Tax=Sphingomonas aracearum TaxID=2283317 RepID=A0A369W1X0_9SPHN|nr:ribonuclease E/G [Sphingomonas aracearum]RDE07272.1 ribonuclease E/G [Sphingomonas aracearum]